LALVDDVRLAELEQFNWQTGFENHRQPVLVYRRFLDAQHPGHWWHESLSKRILGTHTCSGQRVYHLNGDRLDFQAANLSTTAQHTGEVTPGSSFASLPGFSQAIAQRLLDEKKLAQRFPKRGRTPALTDEQARAVLTQFLELEVYHGKSLSFLLAELVTPVIETTGVPYNTKQLWTLLHGKTQRQDGIDYDAIARLMPRRGRPNNPDTTT